MNLPTKASRLTLPWMSNPLYDIFHIENDYTLLTRDLQQIETYTRADPDTGRFGTKVQIIATEGIPIRTILEGFYTTVVVNIIS